MNKRFVAHLTAASNVNRQVSYDNSTKNQLKIVLINIWKFVMYISFFCFSFFLMRYTTCAVGRHQLQPLFENVYAILKSPNKLANCGSSYGWWYSSKSARFVLILENQFLIIVAFAECRNNKMTASKIQILGWLHCQFFLFLYY